MYSTKRVILELRMKKNPQDKKQKYALVTSATLNGEAHENCYMSTWFSTFNTRTGNG